APAKPTSPRSAGIWRGIEGRVIASHPVSAKRRRMMGSTKQSIVPRMRDHELIRRFSGKLLCNFVASSSQ
ncbi:MAG: hypothetical protein ACI4XG_27730, partial [Bradyrhizobium sp.]